MSIARSLELLLDRDTLDLVQDTEDGEKPPSPSLQVEEGARLYRCKVCGHEDKSQRYCPKCLADTMRPL